LLKGYALGRGLNVTRVGRAEVVTHKDADVIREELPRVLKRLRRELASTN